MSKQTDITPATPAAKPLICPECGCKELEWAGDHSAWTSVDDVVVNSDGEVSFEWSGYMRYSDDHSGFAVIQCSACLHEIAEEMLFRSTEANAFSQKLVKTPIGPARRSVIFSRVSAEPDHAAAAKEASTLLHMFGIDESEAHAIVSAFAGIRGLLNRYELDTPQRRILQDMAASLIR